MDFNLTYSKKSLLSIIVIIFFAAIQTIAIGKESNLGAKLSYKDKAHVYYVSNSGSDANTGTLSSPFQSISTALGHTSPGDSVIVRGGKYFEKITFPNSGVQNKNITLKGYKGERPIIDGSKVTVTGWVALVTISSIKYISLEGFDICNITSNVFNTDPEGIAINGDSHDITIKNCNIYNIKNNASLANGRSGHAILVIGNGAGAISNLTITGCTVHDTQTGTSENVTLAGNIDGFVFKNNKVYDTENIGIIVAGGDNLNKNGDVATNYARNGVISDNEFHDNTMTRTPDVWGPTRYGAISIYICGGANTIVERNKVYNSDRGIGLVSESNIYATKNIIVRNNLVYNCNRTGIYMGDYLNYTSGGTNNCYVINNTLFKNNKVLGAFGEIEGELRLTENCVNNVISNNLVYAGPTDVFVHKYTSTGSNNTINNNLYFTVATPQWIWQSKNITLTDFNTWKQISANDANSMTGIDPLLQNGALSDFRIQPTSPAKNKGVIIPQAINGTTDMGGNPRIVNTQISIGAYQ